jgi:large subunit ribosomal protein L23
MAELHDIILRPIVTEKTARLEAGQNTYTFQVGVKANKVQIKEAIQSLFGVDVLEVRTVNVRGKTKRVGRFQGRRSDWKKAYVTLAEGDLIQLFESN